MHPDLLAPPHIILAIVDTAPTPSEEQINHLLACPPCRAFLFALAALARSEKEEMRRCERQAAYAEAVVSSGTTEAGRRYPDVVAHVEVCESCRESVAETIAFLRE